MRSSPCRYPVLQGANLEALEVGGCTPGDVAGGTAGAQINMLAHSRAVMHFSGTTTTQRELSRCWSYLLLARPVMMGNGPSPGQRIRRPLAQTGVVGSTVESSVGPIVEGEASSVSCRFSSRRDAPHRVAVARRRPFAPVTVRHAPPHGRVIPLER